MFDSELVVVVVEMIVIGLGFVTIAWLCKPSGKPSNE
jgi:hypothetical protein